MSDLVHHAYLKWMPPKWRGNGERNPLSRLLRKEVASHGPLWLPPVLVLGSIAAVAYADRLVASISLVYLYILPLGVGAIFLRREISYGLIAACGPLTCGENSG